MEKRTIAFMISIMVLIFISFSLAQVQPPIRQSQTPAPVAPSAPPKGGPTIALPKRLVLNPNMLRILKIMPSRSILINTLMANPLMKVQLNSLATQAGMSVKDLAVKSLNNKSISNIPLGKTIEELNWEAGIRFSVVKNRPKFFNTINNKEENIGELELAAVFIITRDIGTNINEDYFYLVDCRGDGYVNLNVFLPKDKATYMITIQGLDAKSSSDPFAQSGNFSSTFYSINVVDQIAAKELMTTDLSKGCGVVGIAQISPRPLGNWGSADISIKPKTGMIFSSITITRL